MKQFYIFGQAYGEGAYGECAYQPNQQQLDACTGTGGGTGGTGGGGAGGTGSGGSLVDTGVAIALAITLACLLIFITLVVRFIRRRPRVATQEVSAEAPRRDVDNFRS